MVLSLLLRGSVALAALVACVGASALVERARVSAGSDTVASPQLELRARVVVRSGDVRLGDLLSIRGIAGDQVAVLNGRVVAAAPLLGQTLRIDRGRLQQQLAQWGIATPQWRGASWTDVQRESQRIEGHALCAAAAEALRVAGSGLPAGSAFDVQCVAGIGGVETGSGATVLQADPAAVSLLDGPQSVAVDVRVDQRVERTVRVPVTVSLRVGQWCAHDSIAAGQPLDPARFAVCMQPLRRSAQLALAGRPLPSGRLARAIRAGDALSSADIAETGVQLRGDIVTVQYRVGALVLESPGELSQNAHVGESVRVRLRGSGDSLVGRLASARLVEVGDQP